MSLIVQKLRLKRGWSQQQLAELSGLSVRTVQRIEGGQNATAESLKSLAAVFEVDFQELRAVMEDTPSPLVPAMGLASVPAPSQETLMTTTPAYASPTPVPPMGTMPADEVQAFKDVRRLRGFYVHLMQYVLVISALFLLNLFMSPGRGWVQWVVLGWGIGLASHGLSIWKQNPIFGANWERRQIEKRIGRKL